MTTETAIGLLFALLGFAQFAWPKKAFALRAYLYKKIYDARVKGSQRTYTIYRIIGIIFLLMGLFFALNSYIYNEKQADNGAEACTLEAKICPDGSAVGRTLPGCEFEACPGE
jgi:hypothetical protein